MAKQVQIRGSTAADHATFAGATREVTFDTTNNRIIAHANSKVGGYPAIHENGDKGLDLTLTGNCNINSKNITLKDTTLDSSLSISSSGIRLRDNNIDKLIINGSEFIAKDNSNISTINFNSRLLLNDWFGTPQTSVDWQNYWLKGSDEITRIDWNALLLYSAGGIPSIDWAERKLFNDSSINILDWNQNLLFRNASGSPQLALNWSGSKTYDNAGIESFDWNNRRLIKSNGSTVSIDWENFQLKTEAAVSIDWGQYQLKDDNGQTRIDWAASQLFDASINESVNWNNRYLYKSDGLTKALDWNNQTLNSGATVNLDWNNKILSGNWTVQNLNINNGTINTASLIISSSSGAPSTRDTNGVFGQMIVSGGYLYVATGTNLWGRVSLADNMINSITSAW